MMRTSIWMLFNCNKIEESIDCLVDLNGERIELCFMNYENARLFTDSIGDWVENKIFKSENWISTCEPNPMECVYLIIKNDYSDKNFVYITELISLCLRITLPPPVVISRPGNYIKNGAIVNPGWQSIPNPLRCTNLVIDNSKVEKLVNLVYRFDIKTDHRYPYFEEVLKVAEINDVLIEVLYLWAFIEGFWNTNRGDSKLDQSFNNLLKTDRFPGANKKDPRIIAIRNKIFDQNEVIGAKNFSRLRNILAHGAYLNLEDSWSNVQWNAIYEQRDLLLHTVLFALVEHNLRKK